MRTFCLGVLAFFVCSLSYPVNVWGQSNGAGVNPAEQYLQMAADRERAVLGLPPLRRDPALAAAARRHALRGSAAGARFSFISENVAVSSSTVRIHDAWMHSEGHRRNLLDTNVDEVGISVVAHGSRLYAVEDFERSVDSLPLKEQESKVGAIVAATGISVGGTDGHSRRSCAGATEPMEGSRPSFVMRYTTSDLNHIPDELQTQLSTGKYAIAVVAACSTDTGNFSMYSIAVLLYRSRSN
jgi:hypothetical protein